MGTAVDISRDAQQNAFARRFAPGLLRPFTGLTLPIRIGEIAQTALSRWSLKPLPPKSESGIRYLTVGGRSHWLMLRESLLSLYCSWNQLPDISVVSDGSWSAPEFYPVFSWWPGKINVLSPDQIIAEANAAGERELAQYADSSAWGLKLAAIVLSARRAPLLFVDADILWFKDPALVLGDSSSWIKPRALQENFCYQRHDMALRYCAQVLEPPFVNAGIVALHGDLMPPELLRSMVQEALRDPQDGSCEQTIFATGIKLTGEFFPEKLSLVAFNDTYRLFIRKAKQEGFYSRHYVLPARQLIYRDALNLRLDLRRLMAGRAENGNSS